MASGFDKTRRVVDAIVKHHMEKYRLDAASPLEETTFLNATFLGKLVQLARPSLEARLLSVRFAYRYAADTGRATMREIRQLRASFHDKSDERYLAMRDFLGGAVPTSPCRVFGEGFQEAMRDILEVQAKDLLHACVLSRRAR